MRVLVACEFSGIVRYQFARLGWDAWSCDLLPTERSGGNHIQGDVREILHDDWDLMIAHPPCTYLCNSGRRWQQNEERLSLQEEALDFVCDLLNAPIKHIALENPIGIISTRIKKPTQIIQPYHFGHPVSKSTAMWLKNLAKLRPTNILPLDQVKPDIHTASPGPDRWKFRSRTFVGIAKAMAIQWSYYLWRQRDLRETVPSR